MICIYIKDPTQKPTRYYSYDASVAWVRKYDNGAMISCGLTVGEGDFKKLPRGAVEVTYEEWNHSGCQSACTLRGAKECHW